MVGSNPAIQHSPGVLLVKSIVEDNRYKRTPLIDISGVL